jgi:hypothetical protein|tara:strand:+ start:188 stop:364 length:177 start_codon:yes stop_codon:yes gene_type:complete
MLSILSEGFTSIGIIRFDNGKSFGAYSKETKVGPRTYYWSGRMMPLSKKDLEKFLIKE